MSYDLWIPLLIGIGGGAGAMVRAFLKALFPKAFPWGTGIANILGSFIFSYAYFHGLNPMWSLALLTGFCGSLTTFSTFILETHLLREQRSIFLIVQNVFLNIALPFLAVATGYLSQY